MAKSSNNRLVVFLKDKNKKSYFKIFKECMYLWVSKKEIPYYYFKHLYKKEVTNYKDYLSTKECIRIQFSKKLKNKEVIKILSNKLFFSIYCKKNNLPVPELLGNNVNSNFFYNSEYYPIESIEDFSNFFKRIIEDKKLDSIFIKPLSMLGGEGCYKISKENLNQDCENIFDFVTNNSCIHEEFVNQHPEINKIHSKCINTIRIEAYIDKNKKTHILSSLMRFGVGKSHVDNSHAGGFFVSIDIENGCLKKFGQTFNEFGAKKILEHPDSKIRLEGYKIPYFKEACDLVILASKYLPDRYVGWDIAITPDGPILIEGNENSNVHGADIAFGGYKRLPIFKEIIEESNS